MQKNTLNLFLFARLNIVKKRQLYLCNLTIVFVYLPTNSTNIRPFFCFLCFFAILRLFFLFLYPGLELTEKFNILFVKHSL